ncbi:uncharacterized protein LOC121642613 [Melanotaenia boesemani]|uniref:uncharacterized protein LOC121642613 n=1 Tax=Melanotaenia boesemani TaxID=1250792 RepID=UPI001C050691|nr:uncharacterized protein LOC121642613 [Melanotaenia boesemani]XP_041845313.1 uncharacterized protein LOC121642613 [Melanotaenia boesemani]
MKPSYKFQRREGSTAEHCCVPLCTSSAKYNSTVSFHTFPSDDQLRKRWVVNIRRENFIISHHTRVCSRHFTAQDVKEPTEEGRRRRLKPGAVPVLFHWNNYYLDERRLGVWERVAREDNMETGEAVCAHDHDYCVGPEPAFVDNVLEENQRLREEVAQLRQHLEQKSLSRFGIQRFVGSDVDIRFFTRFASYDHLMRFWQVIQPSLKYMIQVTRSTTDDAAGQSTPMGQALQPIDEMFLFLNYLALGLKQTDLADRYQIHQSTVSRIILVWSNFLLSVLGAQRIWMTPEKIREYLPLEFRDYADTTVILDCTELRCQTPSSPLLQSEVYSNKSHCTLKGMIGIAPHGPVTFVSPLYAGSISDKQLFVESGLSRLLRPDSAIMVDRSFLIDNCVPCKVYRPAFLSGRPQMPENEVKETQTIAHLRVHVKRVIKRLKEHKLFETVIPLNMFSNINQLYIVACLLLNYENHPQVKAWAK